MKKGAHDRHIYSVMLGLFVVTLCLLSSCGRIDRSRSVIVWEQMDPKEQEFFDQHVEQFKREHPEFADFTIERVHYRTEDLQTQFQTAALAYGGPNLVYGPSDKIGPYSIMGLLMPVEDLLPQSEIDRFEPSVLPVLEGHVWGLPDQVGNHLTLVANMGLVDEIPTNTDDWVRQLKELTVDEDGDGNLWAGTQIGLNRLDRGSGRFTRYRHDPADPASLSHDYVYDVFLDRHGVLWIATIGGGLNRYNAATDDFSMFDLAAMSGGSANENDVFAIECLLDVRHKTRLPRLFVFERVI